MSDYIDREEAKKVFQKKCSECEDACMEFDGFKPDCSQCLMNGAAKIIINELPAADVRPVVNGKWICHDFVDMGKGRYTGSVECPFCHRFLPLKENFCPNCGADMKGES